MVSMKKCSMEKNYDMKKCSMEKNYVQFCPAVAINCKKLERINKHRTEWNNVKLYMLELSKLRTKLKKI